jgi:hypothetical protein
MAELDRFREDVVFGSPAKACIAPLLINLDSGEHQRREPRTSKPCLPARCSQQRSDIKNNAATVSIQLRIEAFTWR